MSAPTLTIAVPAGYDDQPNARAALISAARQLAPDVDYQVVDIAPAADRDGRVVTLEVGGTPTTWDVSEVVADWDAKSGPAALERALRERGARLAMWDPIARRATAMWDATFDSRLRDRVAAAYGVGGTPWEVEIRSHFGADGLPDRYDIVRAPARGDATATLYALPGVQPWWALTESPWHGTMSIERVDRPQLPAVVPLADILPERITPEDWHSLPLGVDAAGEVVSLDLLAGPHGLVVGPTGSGKTIALDSVVVGALTHGHELVLVDPTKAGLDFLSLRPWASAWAVTISEARETLQAVYAEVERRKRILQREGEVKWSDVTASVRDRERIRPVVVVVDEATSLLVLPDTKVVNSLPKESAERAELEELVADKAMIRYLLGKLAREARFVGIHLLIGAQRPDADILGGELRSNLTSVVQLTKPGAVPSTQALGMVFSPDQVPSAQEALSTLDDGRSRGLAAVAAEGGTARGLRIAYAPMRDLAGLLTERGVPHATPWRVDAMSDTVDTELEAEVVELGTVDIDWGDAFAPAPAASGEIPWDDDDLTPTAHQEMSDLLPDFPSYEEDHR